MSWRKQLQSRTIIPGQLLTISRHDVDYVLSEHGVAHLRRKILRVLLVFTLAGKH